MGYGLRPDPAKQPTAYASWLEAASRPAREATAARQRATKMHFGQTGTVNNAGWGGPVLTGTVSYGVVSATLQVPRAIPGGDGTGNGLAGLWAGLGGTNFFGPDPTVLQDGVAIQTTTTTATYSAWIEYFPNLFIFEFSVSPADQIFAEAWACDSTGNASNSGYGCFYIQDNTTGVYRACTSRTGSPCASIPSPGPFNGFTAEFIMEKAGPYLPDYLAGADVFNAAASDSDFNEYNFGNDAYVMELLIGSRGQSLESATVYPPAEVQFAFSERGGGR